MTESVEAGISAEKIRGKVAAIVTPRSLVINRGRSHGVRVGMMFSIYYTIGPIADPDDPSNMIEALTFRKGTAEVTQVYAKMAYCSLQPLRRTFIRAATLFPSLYETTEGEPVYPQVLHPMVQQIESSIKVGDPVEQIEEEKRPPAPPTGLKIVS